MPSEFRDPFTSGNQRGFAKAGEFGTVAVMGKHVIFLGAGASKSSGYPLANELRLRLSSENHFVSWVKQCFPKAPEGTVLAATEYFRHFESSIDLFRRGAFASVDEFCRCISDQCKPDGDQHELDHVENMRWLTRAVLGALNPEHKFEDSEYYLFIQKLFRTDSLEKFRDDISILTYNYDPYLEFLLLRAWAARNGGCWPADADLGNSITGGFFNPQNLGWTESNQPRLRLLKLHGSICSFVAGERLITPDHLFEDEGSRRAGTLFDSRDQRRAPPIIFPWEILDEDLRFRDKDFPNHGAQNYRIFFHKVWERAREEVQGAEKISFVGLSMHGFLKLGFRYLFKGKSNRVQVVVANTLNKVFRESYRTGQNLPNSPCQQVIDLLNEVTDINRITSAGQLTNQGHRVIARYSFEDFIKNEL